MPPSDERDLLLQLKYHAKIYSNWFLLAWRLIHYVTDSSTLLRVPYSDKWLTGSSGCHVSRRIWNFFRRNRQNSLLTLPLSWNFCRTEYRFTKLSWKIRRRRLHVWNHPEKRNIYFSEKSTDYNHLQSNANKLERTSTNLDHLPNEP